MILDTNSLSAFADGVESLQRLLHAAPSVEVPVIVLGEFRYGIEQSRDRARYQNWMAEFRPRSRVLAIDEETWVRYAQIRNELRRAGTPIPPNDAWIAALCRQHSLPLLSRDRHFDSVRGIHRIDW